MPRGRHNIWGSSGQGLLQEESHIINKILTSIFSPTYTQTVATGLSRLGELTAGQWPGGSRTGAGGLP